MNATTDNQDHCRLARLFWGGCLLGWAGLFVTTSTSLVTVGYFEIGVAMLMALSVWTPYAVMTPAVFALSRSFPVGLGGWRPRNILVHLVACALFIVICETAFYTLAKLTRPRISPAALEQFRRQAETAAAAGDQLQPEFATHVSLETGELVMRPRMLMLKSQFDVPLYCFLVAFAHALLISAKLRERESQAARLREHLARAQLAELKAQLQPHFLFNTLNSISALIPHDPKMANEMLLNLSDLLRMALRQGEENEVSLEEELALLELYVDIQKIRFGERLDFAVETDEAAREALVPPLLLQPLVENAIRHGVEPSDKPEQIRVRAVAADERMTIEVTNTFAPNGAPATSAEAPTGIGLANTRSRLRTLHGDDQSFHIHHEDGSFRVSLELPRRREYESPVTT